MRSQVPTHLLRGAVLLERGEIAELAALLRPGWRQMADGIEGPVNTIGGFRERIGTPDFANQTTVAAAADTILWDATNLTPLAANQVNRPGQMFKVTAFGVTTTAVTGSQTLIVTPRFGTTTAGTSLGASRTAPVNAAVQTNVPWFLEMWVQFRTTGASGTAVCGGLFTSPTVVGTAATTNAAPLNFGTGATTATTVNTTTASGLVVSVTPSLATQTFTTLAVSLEAIN